MGYDDHDQGEGEGDHGYDDEDAPACGRGHAADAPTAPHSFGRSLFGEQRDDA